VNSKMASMQRGAFLALAIGLTGCVTGPHDGLDAALWVQTSDEYRGLVEQAYALASIRLEEGLADPEWTACLEQDGEYAALPPAVILDLDETVLDNSAYQAWLVVEDTAYDSDSWEAWCHTEQAELLPGAKAFIEHAESRGVTVFYETNPSASVEESTRSNLARLGVDMQGEEDRLLTKGEREGWGSNKVPRRELITRDYRVLLSIGDNLGDFVDGYRDTPAARRQVYEAHAERWGMQWIVLPNPNYGSWMDALHGFDYGAPAEAKRDRKRSHLRAWEPAE